MTDLFWPEDDRAGDLPSDAALVAEQRSLAALTGAEPRARVHLEETP